MPQLSDDCFSFPGPLMTVAEAERLIDERIMPVAGMEDVPLAQAHRRVLVPALVAPIDLPPFSNSAVDGYAVRHRDLDTHAKTRLVVADRVAAGHTARASVRPKQAVRIFTGAPMPRGADTVFMQEDAHVDGAHVVLPPGLRAGANLRHAGEDVAAGSIALAAGTRMTPADVALAAALGVAAVTVRRRVKVALFSTGDEVTEPGAARPAARIFDANRPMLAALLHDFPATVTDLGILRDDPVALADALAMAASEHDLIITSGGVSTGEADHVRGAVEQSGRLVFWRIAIKPGRPVAMGVISGLAPETRAVFVGLPGNPVAAFVTFVRIVRPLLLRLAGARPEPLVAYPVQSGFAYAKKAGRREYIGVRLERLADGMLRAHKHPQDGAGIITSLTATDGLAELGEDMTAVAPGDAIGVIPYTALTG
jgi:molybdopterin molybdotransferase